MRKCLCLILSVCVFMSLCPAFYATAETYTNLSLDSTVTVDRYYKNYSGDMVKDGDYSTYWYFNNKDDDLTAEITLELSDIAYIDHIIIIENWMSADSYFSDIQTSLDGENWISPEKSLSKTSGAEYGTSSKAGRKRVYTFSGTVVAKYVRLKSPHDNHQQIREFEIYGKIINPYLNELSLSSGELTPAFNKEITSYDVKVESKDNLPTVYASAAGENSTVEITQADETTMKATVSVKTPAATGKADYISTYVVNMISIAANAELKNISVGDGKLLEEFEPETTEYSVYLEEGASIPTVSAESLSGVSSVDVTQATEENLTATITVTSGDGENNKTYTVEFVPTGSSLLGISVSGYSLSPVFDENVTLYTVEMESVDGVEVFPEIIATKKYDNAEITITEATADQKQTTIKVTSALGSEKTYRILFERACSYENIALNATVKANGEVNGYPVSNVVDGNYGTMWYVHKDSVDKGQLIVELSDIALIDNIKIYENNTSATDSMYSNIECSLDGIIWTAPEKTYTRYSSIQLGTLTSLGRKRVYTMTETVAAKYIRLTGVSGRNLIMQEIEVYGKIINPYLSSLSLSSGELTPAFNKATTFYDVYVESDGDLPTVTGAAENADATVEITQANQTTMQAVINITVENGEYTHKYIVNMVPKFSDANLKKLEVSSGTLMPEFSREQEEYSVYIGPDEDIPTVSALTLSESSTVQYTQATKDNLTATVKVTSSDKNSVKEYKVNFIVTGTDLKTISAGTKELTPVFDPQHTSYGVVIESDEDLPEITAEAMYSTKSVTITQPTESTMLAKITVNSNLNESKTYQIKFYRRSNDESSARLSYIGLSKGNIEGEFDPDKTEHTVYVESRVNLPVVTAFTEHNSATALVTQADSKTMTAKINVTSADGVQSKEYKVYFLINTSLGRMCNASSNYSSTGPDNAFDGNLTTQWRASTGAAPQWIFCDIGANTTVHEVVISTRYSSDPDVFSVIQKSDDGKNWTTVEFNGTNVVTVETQGSVPSYDKITYSCKPFTAHYLKVTSPTPRQLAMEELEVYGILAPIVSSNSYLKTLEFSNGTLIPAFSPYVSKYTLVIGKNDSLPTITEATPVNDFSQVDICQATEETMQAQVTVTAENGIKKTVYTVSIDKEVEPEKNTYLERLAVFSGELYPEFSYKNSSYTVYLLPQEEIPEVTAVAAIAGAKVTIIQDGNNAQVKVTSKDGTAERIYTVSFVYVNAELRELTIPNASITPSLTSGVYEYTAEIPAGAEIPEITAVAAGDATVSITQADSKTMKAIIEVKANGAEYVKTYTINFKYRQSLEETIASVLAAVKDYKASNDTTKEDITSVIQNAVTNSDISFSWKSYSKEKATSKKAGEIIGILCLTMEDISGDVEIRKVLAKLSDSGASGGGGSSGGGGTSGGGSSAVSFGNASGLPANSKNGNALEGSKDVYSEIRGHWAEKEVIALNNKGIVKGNGESFALDDKVTRAEFITMLIRACDIETLPYYNVFTDVKDTDWFATFIQTAKEKGIIEGAYGEANPNGSTSREEAVKMLVSAYELINGTIDETEDINFTDSEKISSWAKDYVKKAVAKGFVKGYDTGEFAAKDTLNRAQAMVMIYRLMDGN